MRFSFLFIVAAITACASPPPAQPAPVPVPVPAPMPATASVAAPKLAPPTAPRPGPVDCAGDPKPNATWELSERAHREASTPFVSAVRIGNQVAIGYERAVTWAYYLNAIHNQLHPFFADNALSLLCKLPPGHPMNEGTLNATIELAITPDGQIEKIGVVKTSGILAFDEAAITSFERITTMPPLDPSLLSADGRAHFHWTFFRDPIFACSTMHARPFMLK